MSKKLLSIKFVGTNYCGWQVQKNAVSIQQKLCEAFYKLYGENINITGCSRTDAGVHANRYCLHFNDIKNLNNKNIIKAINSYLPEDIAAFECQDVPDDFHARYSCKEKTYIYKIYNGERNPFNYKKAFYYKNNIDIDKINIFAKDLLGTHDFTSFCSSKTSIDDKTRTLTEAVALIQDDFVVFKFTANGFLYNMVRILSGTFLAVSEGKIMKDSARQIILNKNRDGAGITLPPEGLYLENVIY